MAYRYDIDGLRGLAIALVVALMRLSRIGIVSQVARFYVSVIRGTPLLVQLFLIFYGLPAIDLTFNPFTAAITRTAHS